MECEDQDTQQRDPKTHEMYLNVMRRFSQALLKVFPCMMKSIVVWDNLSLKKVQLSKRMSWGFLCLYVVCIKIL